MYPATSNAMIISTTRTILVTVAPLVGSEAEMDERSIEPEGSDIVEMRAMALAAEIVPRVHAAADAGDIERACCCRMRSGWARGSRPPLARNVGCA